ncbi:uncharacterized protein LOC132002878 [Mustela nigripes]|uniref:uncharacterized protein LOC132002878 n=1 Tax=Mustela nigripes TaxID=77151 RepID=UPI002814BFCD|nr:uncharacterized protein LOC132002878 [Mustela nigripes]XP_059234107.1 uncharacterized protein LOC132002878 [Mustela nigripes]
MTSPPRLARTHPPRSCVQNCALPIPAWAPGGTLSDGPIHPVPPGSCPCVTPAPWAKAQVGDLLPVNTTQRKPREPWAVPSTLSYGNCGFRLGGSLVHSLPQPLAGREASGHAVDSPRRQPCGEQWRSLPTAGKDPGLPLAREGEPPRRPGDAHSPGQGPYCRFLETLSRSPAARWLPDPHQQKPGNDACCPVAEMGRLCTRRPNTSHCSAAGVIRPFFTLRPPLPLSGCFLPQRAARLTPTRPSRLPGVTGHFSKELCSRLCWKMVFRSQDLGGRCASCWCRISCPSRFPQCNRHVYTHR